MGRLGVTFESLFRRQMAQDEDVPLALERLSREIRGSILTLITLFFVLSLSSYVPIDTLNIFDGRLDFVHNLGGIVGALAAEFFLGSVGAMGYGILFLTAWLSFAAFRGDPLRDRLLKIIGCVISGALGAIALFLTFQDTTAEMSLLQGGFVGRTLGKLLEQLFNTTGAFLVVGGAFLLVVILTTHVSITRLMQSLWDGRLDSNEIDEEEAAEVKKPIASKPAPSQKAAPKKLARKRKSKANADPDADTTDDPDADPDATTDDSIDPDADSAPDSGEPKAYKFEELVPFTGSSALPSTRLLKNHDSGAKKLSSGEIKNASRKLCEHLLSFQITGNVTTVSQGPVLVTYEYKPSAGVKLSKIASLQDDLGVVLGTNELRIVAPIPGKTVVGIEVPRPKAETIPFKDLVSEKGFYDKKLKLPVVLGKTTDGRPVFGDLTAMPHLLVAGATGSGKSVFINSLIMSLLYRLDPQQLRMILVDPKMLELNVFDGIPHLISNVITRSDRATNALRWAVDEMERRYDRMSQTGSKNIDSYNSKVRGAQKIPYIVIVIDELADLMMSGDRDEVETSITRLAQKARAAGIHLVIATQRPSTDVITGLIKANIPSRLSFKVPSGIDSRTVLDTGGAESLVGKGDSLMVMPGIPLQRIHGCFVSEEELSRVVKNVIGSQNHQSLYLPFG